MTTRIEAYAKENYNSPFGYYGVCKVYENGKLLYTLETEMKNWLTFRDAELDAYALRRDLCPELYDKGGKFEDIGYYVDKIYGV